MKSRYNIIAIFIVECRHGIVIVPNILYYYSQQPNEEVSLHPNIYISQNIEK